jgi:hypothetical protein
MIKIETEELSNGLTKYIAEMKRKLEAAVAGFAYEASFILVSNTPIGDDLLIAINASYRNYYQDRMNNYGLPMQAGFHKGAWKYTESSPSFTTSINPYQGVPTNVQSSAGSSYNLGDKFYIAAKGPAFEVFELGSNKQAPNGVLQPSVAQIMKISSVTMQTYFDNG